MSGNNYSHHHRSWCRIISLVHNPHRILYPSLLQRAPLLVLVVCSWFGPGPNLRGLILRMSYLSLSRVSVFVYLPSELGNEVPRGTQQISWAPSLSSLPAPPHPHNSIYLFLDVKVTYLQQDDNSFFCLLIWNLPMAVTGSALVSKVHLFDPCTASHSLPL